MIMVLRWAWAPQSAGQSDKSGVTLLTCMAIFAAARYMRCRRRRALNGKDPTFDAGFAVAGVGRIPEATGLLGRSGHRNQSRLGSASSE